MKKIKLLCLLTCLLCFSASCSSNQNQPAVSDKAISDTDNVSPENTSGSEIKETEIPKIVTKLTATYNGETTAGTKLNALNEGISVIATYDDGSEDTISDYHVEEPTALKAGKTSKIVISYENSKCDLNVKCTTLTKKQYKNKCKSISYKNLARNPDKYEGKKVKFTGQIIQVMESDWTTAYRIDVTKGDYGIWDDTVYVEFDPDSDKRFLEDDIVSFYGIYDGLYTYETVLGSSVTIPSVIAEYMDLKK